MTKFRCKGMMYMRNGIAFGVLHLPKNKGANLCLQVKNNIIPLASFMNEEKAQLFLDSVEKWMMDLSSVNMEDLIYE